MHLTPHDMHPIMTRPNATMRRWIGVAALVGLGALLPAGCRGGGSADEGATTSTIAAATSTTTAFDPTQPRTATGANSNPRDDRIGPPARNRPSDGSLAEGSCFNEFLEQRGEALVHRLQAADCAKAHDGEVFAVLLVEGPEGAVFAGESEIGKLAAGRCLARFEAFIGMEYATSTLRIATLRPTGTTWATGDRTVVCSLYDEDLRPLVGTARASRR